MLAGLIQSLFFLSICTMTYGMDSDQQQMIPSKPTRVKVQPLPNNFQLSGPKKGIDRDQQTKVHEKLYAKHEIQTTPSKPTPTNIQPLTNLPNNPLTIKTNHAIAAYKKGDPSQIIPFFNKIVPQMTHQPGVLRPETEKAHNAIKKSMKELAKTNLTALANIDNHLLDRCMPLFTSPLLIQKSALFLKIQTEETKLALEFLGFLHPLAQENKLITLDCTKSKIDDLKQLKISPAVSYILDTCKYLQAITNTEKNYSLFLLNKQHCSSDPAVREICQFLINYGDITLSSEDAAKKLIQEMYVQPDLIAQIAQTPVCSHVIAKLRNAQFKKDDPLSHSLSFVLAELYYNLDDYKNAHDYYTQLPPNLLNNKSKLHAYTAYIASTTIFDEKKIDYYTSVNLMLLLQEQEKKDPQLSYNIGLFMQALIKKVQHPRKIMLMSTLQHLDYAQKYGVWNKEELIMLANMRTEINTLLSSMDTYNHHHDDALKNIIDALEYRAAYSNNPQDCAILTLLEQTKNNDPNFYQKYTPCITTILHLIYNHNEQKDLYLWPDFVSSNFFSPLLPYLEQAYTTNTNNKHTLACLLALAHQQRGDFLKAYNYKRILPKDSPYKKQLLSGIFSLDDKKDSQLILQALDLLEKDKQNPGNPIIKPMCQFMLNELPLDSFINTIISQTNISHAISQIAQTPLYSEIINRLSSVTLEINNPLLPDFNCVLAELYYHSNQIKNAHEIYKTIHISPKDPYTEVRSHAFDACITNTTVFEEKEIQYLSSLYNNIRDQLKTLDTTNHRRSYNIGILTHELLKNNCLNVSERMSLIMNSVDHLAYAQQYKNWNPKQLKNILRLKQEAHSSLSLIYQSQNNYHAALEETKHALECRAWHHKNKQDKKIITILTQAEKNNSELYNQLAPVTKIILDFIDNQNLQIDIHENYGLLSQFVLSNLSQLLPYCEQAYTTSTSPSSDITYLMALYHKNNKSYDKAYDYINKIETPANGTLALKADIYANVFSTYITNTTVFGEKEIEYLSSLYNNIGDQLKTLDKTDPQTSYNIGILTAALLKNNKEMDDLEKIALIIHALNHLGYAQKNGVWDKKSLEMILKFGQELHSLQATMYQDQKNYVTSLKETKLALECRSQLNKNKQDHEILAILTQAEENNPELYNQYALLTKNILHCIDNQHQKIEQQKDYNLLSQFALSNLCAQLLPYCEQAYTTSTNPSNDITYLMALYHKNNKNYDKAYDYINKIEIPVNGILALKTDIYTNVFNTYVTNTTIFGKKEIEYLASLCNNIGDQLKTLDKTDPQKSYNIASLTQALLKNNTEMNDLETIALILHALDHLAYTQKNGAWDKEQLQTILQLNQELNTLLSTSYDKIHDSIASLKHIKRALEYRSQQHNNKQDHEILAILTQAEENNPELYNQYALLTKDLLHCINNQSSFAKASEDMSEDRHYDLLFQFTLSDLCSQLFPYWQQVYEKHTDPSHDMTCFMALYHKNNKRYEKAYDYINKIETPANGLLALKADIYALTKKALPDKELEIILNLFINDKEIPSEKKRWLILSLIRDSTKFFIQTQNHALALKLITKLTDQNNMPPVIIGLVYHIEESLINTKNSYVENWRKELVNIDFYKKLQEKNPSDYTCMNNYAAGFLLIQQETIIDYEKTIAYITAALDNKESEKLPTRLIDPAKKCCAHLYHDWAATVTNDTEECLRLLDKSLEYNDTDQFRCEKAIFILKHSVDKNLINSSLQTLEQIIQNLQKIENPSEEFHEIISLAKIALGEAYCNHNNNHADLIPFDMDKAMYYLEDQAIDKSLLIHLLKIFKGESECKDYINPAKELICNELLMEHDINSTEKEMLLIRKIELLLAGMLDDNAYDQILTCFQQIKTNNDHCINFDTLPALHKHTNDLVSNNIMTERAIKWCCYAAASIVMNRELLMKQATPPSLPPTTDEQKELARYLLSAAKSGNFHAQIAILCYCSAIDYYTSGIEHYEILKLTHEVLMNPDVKTKGINVTPLVDALLVYVKKGVALPCYILCDYYKNDREQLEKIMEFSSKAPKQTHSLDDTTNTVSKITLSCKPIFMPYIERCMKSKNPSLNEVIATFIFGAMCACSNDENVLNAARLWLETVDKSYKKLNLLHYKAPLDALLASVYYELAIRDKKNGDTQNVDYKVLSKATERGSLPAAIILAKIHIQQYENGEDLLVPQNAFLPLIFKDIQEKPCHPDSVKISEKLIALREGKATKKQPLTNKEKPASNTNTPPKNNLSETEKRSLMSKTANEKQMIKNEHYKERSVAYQKAVFLYDQGNAEESDKLLQQAMTKESHACASMMFATHDLTRSVITKEYVSTKKSLIQALKDILVIKAIRGKTKQNITKQFHNFDSLYGLFSYIESVLLEKTGLTENHSLEVQCDLISTIKTTLKDNGINLTDFEELFTEATDMVLSKFPQWSMEILVINGPNLDAYKPIKYTQNYLDGIAACKKGDTKKGVPLLELAAKKHDPFACLTLAFKYFKGDGVPNQDFQLSETCLSQALFHGMIGKRFCDEELVETLCMFIEMVVNADNKLSATKKKFLATIKKELTDKGANLIQFEERVQDKKKITLSLHPGWAEKEPTVRDCLNAIQKKNDTVVYVKSNKTIIANLKKDLIKNPQSRMSSDIEKGREAANQGKVAKSTGIFTHAAKYQHDPCAGMIIATNQLITGSVASSEEFLVDALLYGVINNQFCNENFLLEVGSYIHMIFSADPMPQVKEYLLSIIKNKLIKHKIDLTHFCAIVEDQTGDKLAECPEWIGTKEKASKEAILANLKKSLVKNPETSLSNDFLNAVEACKQGQPKKCADMLVLAAKNQHDPCALLAAACTYLIGKILTQSISSSKEFLVEALLYGLVENKFCNNELLNQCCEFVETVMSTPNLSSQEKEDFLSIIKNKLIEHKIDLTLFCTIVKGETNASLNECLEWIGIKEKPSKQTILANLKKSLVQNPESKDSPNCLNAVMAIKEGKIQRSEKCLIDSLVHGLTENKFCSNALLTEVCTYIQTVITDPNLSSHEKEHLLSIIKTKLMEHKINLTLFCTIVNGEIGKNLAECPEWIGIKAKEKKEEPVIHYSNSTNLCTLFKEQIKAEEKDMDLLGLLEIEFQQLEQLAALKKSMIKDPEDDLAPVMHAIIKAQEGNNLTKLSELMNKSKQEKNPLAFLSIASGYINPHENIMGQDLQKIYDLSEENLCKALGYGLVAQKFCCELLVGELFAFISKVKKQISSKQRQQKFLSIIRKELEKNNIKPTDFCKLYEAAMKSPLSFSPEQPTEEKKAKQMNADDPIKNMIKNPEDSTSPTFLAALQGYNEHNVAKVLELGNKLFKEGKNSSASAFLLILSALLEEQKNHDLSEQCLRTALDNGLVAQKFCSRVFLNTLFSDYMDNIKNINPQRRTYLANIVIKKLENNNFNYIDFLKLKLSFSSEQPTEKKESKQKNVKILHIDDLKESIVADSTDEMSPIHQAMLEALLANNIPKAIELSRKAIKEENDPSGYIYIASLYLKGQPPLAKNYTLSEEYLRNALKYGLKPQKICDYDVLEGIFGYLDSVSANVPNKQKKLYLVSIVKTELVKHNINLADFCTLYEATTEKEFSFDSEQSKNMLPTKPVENKQKNNIELPKKPVNNTIIEKQLEQKGIDDFYDSIINNPEDPISPAFLTLQQAIDQGDHQKALNLAHAAIKELTEDPLIYIYIATRYTMKKDYNLSEQYLCKALEYGLKTQKFCNSLFGTLVFEYIHQTIKTISNKEKKQALSIIKKELEKNHINLDVFCGLFEIHAEYPLSFS